MMMDPLKIKARNRMRFYVNSILLVTTVAGLLWLFSMSKELIVPIVLGVFFGYLLRPIFYFKSGPGLVKLAKGVTLFSIIFLVFYVGFNFVKSNLPNEKDKLILSVRLQYQLNERFKKWMDINENTGQGNALYNYLKDDLDPLLARVNKYLSLTKEQRSLYRRYRYGHKGEPRIEDKYYNYYLSNLKIMHNVEAETEALQAADTETKSSDAEGAGKLPGLAQIIHLASIWLIFPLTMIIIILDRGQLRQGFMRVIPNRYFELTRNVLDNVDDALGKYIRGTLIQCSMVGLTICLGLFLLGFNIKTAIMVGLIGGITNAIPFLGPAMAFMVGGGFALIAENINPVLPFINLDNVLLGVMLVMVAAQLLDNAVFQPFIVGGAVSLHPLAVIIGAFIGSMSFGFAGLLLAIPTLVILKVVVQTLYSGLKAYRII